MSKRDTYKAELLVRKGEPVVRCNTLDMRTAYATRDQNGRIKWDRPERVPDWIKSNVAPKLFAQYDEKTLGIPASHS